jgi:hypothetical protein
MAALTDYRNFIRESVAGFDGTTDEAATYSQLKYVWTTPTTTAVGRFTPAALNRVAGTGQPAIVSVVRVMLEGTLGPTDEVRVVDSSGATRFTRAASLESSGWMFMGPEDVLEIEAPDATKADILVNDLTDSDLQAWILSEVTASGNQPVPPAQSSIVVTTTQQLPAFNGHLVVFVLPGALAIDITLPPLGSIALDDKITFVRDRGGGGALAVARVITETIGTRVNNLTGVADTQFFMRSEQDSVEYTRIPNGWARRQGTQAPQLISDDADPIVVPAWQEGTVSLFDRGTVDGNVTQLPALIDCRQGCRLVILASSITAGVHALAASGGDTINGKTGPYRYACGYSLAVGDAPQRPVITVEHAGTTWIVSADQGVTFPTVTLNAAGVIPAVGALTRVEVELAADGDITLPAIADLPFPAELVIVRTGGAGTPRIVSPTTVNGIAAGDADYSLNSIGDSVSYRSIGGGWTRPQGTGASDPVVGAGAIVVPDYILGEYFVESTGAGGQTVTLPDLATVAVGTKVYHYNSSGNAHVLAAAAGNTILGAASQPIVTVSGFVAYSDGSTDWKGWTTP